MVAPRSARIKQYASEHVGALGPIATYVDSAARRLRKGQPYSWKMFLADVPKDVARRYRGSLSAAWEGLQSMRPRKGRGGYEWR